MSSAAVVIGALRVNCASHNHFHSKMLTVNVLKFGTLYSILFWPKLCILCSSEMANIVDPDQTAASASFSYAIL